MRVIGRVLRFFGTMLLGAITAALTIYVLMASNMPDLRPWHEPLLQADFSEKDRDESFADYREREDRIFAELARGIERRAEKEGDDGLQSTYDRYRLTSPSNPAHHPRNWNRTFILDHPEPRGGALLLHGLSDSPYSLRSAGEALHSRGFYVVGLRIPGHGTLPGELRRVTWRDWREAVSIAARHVVDKIGPDRPFHIVGYSNGGALAAEYAARALLEGDRPAPSSLILFSPAIDVSPTAALARFQLMLASIPGLEKLAWTSIQAEFDPYKYNSFPVAAGSQIYGLTANLGVQLAQLAARGQLAEFPPILAFQSVVDATIPANAVVERLLALLPANGSELVLFDINRLASAENLLRTDHREILTRLADAPAWPFGVTLLTNASNASLSIVARHRPSDSTTWSETPLELAWPRSIFSLSHVALPFSPEDPIYGIGEDDGDPSHLRLGAVQARGERGVFSIPMNQMMRLRYNPFFPYVEQRLIQWRAEGEAGGRGAR